jgi:protein pelota
MKLLKSSISGKNNEGSVKLRAEEEGDMWHAFHLIGIGDHLKTFTLRKGLFE